MSLREIADSVQQIAEAVASVLHVEVEIADHQLLRIAGTGKTEPGRLQAMAGEDFVYQAALRTGQPVVIDSPGTDPLCRPCMHYGNCAETGEICCPIRVNGIGVGVIGLLAFDQKQRDRLFSDVDSIFLFLQKMAELIAMQIKEHQMYREQQLALERLQAAMQQDDAFAEITGTSAVITRAKEMARRAAESDSTVLLLGESGTGKELFARAIHKASPRRNEPFVSLNCAAIPDTLMESEFFGYEEGAFTGARRGGKKGLFETADKGTIFLDEIGDMPMHLQGKLLRVLQEKQVVRVGGEGQPVGVDVRVVAATHRDLAQLVREGAFRQDLYYRLHVIPIHLPPLRERREDILPLAHLLLQKNAARLGKQLNGFTPEVQARFVQHDWPGNVRELSNVVEYASTMEHRLFISPENLPATLWTSPSAEGKAQPVVGPGEGSSWNLKQIEQRTIRRVMTHLERANRPKEEAAQLLGVSRATLFRKLKEMRICERSHRDP
ncbi:sigma-54 interaction domain-containing protein [Brevibacillus borstelensis]|uniref:sigma-54 interaction domain-containing protein n=1 Tax=Brevibacillus borstelensis TaxID=45462 RepID=UPI003CECBAC0